MLRTFPLVCTSADFAVHVRIERGGIQQGYFGIYTSELSQVNLNFCMYNLHLWLRHDKPGHMYKEIFDNYLFRCFSCQECLLKQC